MHQPQTFNNTKLQKVLPKIYIQAIKIDMKWDSVLHPIFYLYFCIYCTLSKLQKVLPKIYIQAIKIDMKWDSVLHPIFSLSALFQTFDWEHDTRQVF